MALTKAQKGLRRGERSSKRAWSQGKYRGRELSSVIGELSACEELDLRWEPSVGFDARSGDARVQIKTRKSWSTPGVNPSGRMGRFERKGRYLFDVAVYIELDNEFNVSGIWRIPKDGVEALEDDKEKGRRGLHVGVFKSNAQMAWPDSGSLPPGDLAAPRAL